MRKRDIQNLLLAAVSAIALVLFFRDLKIVSLVLAILALIIGISTNNKASTIFTLSVIFNGAVVGYIIDHPLNHYPATLVSLVLFPIIFNIRNIFFNKIALHSYLWADLTLSLLNLFVFIFGAFYVNYDTTQWIAGGLTNAFYTFFAFIIFIDRSGARKLVSVLPSKIGLPAPPFELADQNGNNVSLKSLLSDKHLLLIFVRGDWCPSCHIMLRGYVRNKDLFAQKGVRIVGIGPDPQGVNKEIMNRIDENSLLLSDPEQEIGLKYINSIQENNPTTKSIFKKGIPLPASFLVHQNGTIIFTSRSDKAGEILQPDKITEVLAQL